MGDHMKKTRPIVELEELYRGIPDESVNLTFKDLVNVNSPYKKNTAMIEHISEASISSNPTKVPSPSHSPLSKRPSLDFQKGLQASYHNHHHQDSPWGHFSHASVGAQLQSLQSRANNEYSMMSRDIMSGGNFASGKGGSGRRRRPGIPHSKICTVCSNYVYFLRTRCLVCGRVYCRQCVEIGMGEMSQGRKCIECLGLRFSQRYLERAGMIGCCSWRYPSTLKHAELNWAEKGPRRSGDRGYGHHSMASTIPRTPTAPRSSLSITQPSFVMSATYPPFSAQHHLPLRK